MTRTWAVVADGSRARVFESLSADLRNLKRIEQFDHPEGRARNSELLSDRPGRATATGGGPVALDPRSDAHRVELDRFARTVAESLEASALQRRYERLVLVAPAMFLGLLRSHLGRHSGERVAASIDHDYTSWTDDEVARTLPDRL